MAETSETQQSSDALQPSDNPPPAIEPQPSNELEPAEETFVNASGEVAADVRVSFTLWYELFSFQSFRTTSVPTKKLHGRIPRPFHPAC